MRFVTVILAAGMGVRMQSSFPKVMQCLAGKPILAHVLDTVTALKAKEVRIVVGKELLSQIESGSLNDDYSIKIYEQKERLGTAHALSCALTNKPKLPVLVLNGDCPLIRKSTLKKLYNTYIDQKASVAVLAFKSKKPKGYGRLIAFGEDLLGVVEEKDATDEQRKINLCNAGAYIIDPDVISDLLKEIKNDNSAQEYYLPDIVEVANKKGLKTVFSVVRESEVIGINDRVQLAKAENTLQNRLRKKIQLDGVTLIDPKTVYLSTDTVIGKDTIVYPNVFFGTGVRLGEGCKVLPFSHIEGLNAGNHCRIGPFARIRPETSLGDHCRIGNFVEVKAAELGDNVKASHLSYLGNGKIGKNSNVGAGTVFCNYDGYAKHRTQIGNDVFIGSNVALVAPIRVGDRAIIGAGSVVTEDIDDDTLSIGRARQVNYRQKAELIRRKKSKRES